GEGEEDPADPELGDDRGGPGKAAGGGVSPVRARAGVAQAQADLLVHVGDDRPGLEELLRLLGPPDPAGRRALRRQARARGVPGGGAAVRLRPGLRPLRAFFATCGNAAVRTSVRARTLGDGCRRTRTRSSFRARGSTTCAAC